MLHNHSSEVIDNETAVLVVGGGGNCFSFGTAFNSYVVRIDLQQFRWEAVGMCGNLWQPCLRSVPCSCNTVTKCWCFYFIVYSLHVSFLKMFVTSIQFCLIIPPNSFQAYVIFFLYNQQDPLIIQIYSVIKFYMFRASSLSIIRSSLLYVRHW